MSNNYKKSPILEAAKSGAGVGAGVGAVNTALVAFLMKNPNLLKLLPQTVLQSGLVGAGVGAANEKVFGSKRK